MAKTIQVRNIPDALHRTLTLRAAAEGVSLSRLVLAELRRCARRPSLEELRRRFEGPPRGRLHESPAQAIRAERDTR